MSDFDDLDDLFGPLRSPATPAELTAEHDVVDLMVAAHHTSKGTTMFTSRRARVATLIAAGILGFGGAAAASPGGVSLFDSDDSVKTEVDEPSEPPADEPPAEEPPAEETPAEEPPADDGTPVDEPATVAESEPEDDPEDPESEVAVVADVEPAPVDPQEPEPFCIPDANHGKTVSAAARGLAPFDEGSQFADMDVRDVARSSCGKTGSDSDGETGDVEETDIDDDIDDIDDIDEVEEVEEVEKAEKAEQRTSPGKPEHSGPKSNNGNGKSNNGNGKKGG